MLTAIPRFYTPRTGASQQQSDINSEANNNSTKTAQLKQLARKVFLQRKRQEVTLEDDDFRLLLGKMAELCEPNDGVRSLDGKTMTFENFVSLAQYEDISPIFRTQIFTPKMFFAFPRTIDGLVYADCAFSCAAEMREQRRIRFELAEIDKANSGFLTEMQLVQYFDPFMRDIPEDHRLFYIAVIVRKFIFFLERDKKVSIRDFMSSPILLEWRQRDLLSSHHHQSDNWFSSKSIYMLYDLFVELDEDGNMLLNQHEFLRFYLGPGSGLPRITPLIVQRVFQTKVARTQDNPNGELDFRNFLDFVLAFQSKSHPASLRYYWSLLDVNETGRLTGPDIREFVKEVFETLTEAAMRTYAGGDVNADDVKDEIFDMAKVASDEMYITFDDLIKSGHGATIVNLLTDPAGFVTYEQREYVLQPNQMQQQQHPTVQEELAQESDEYADAAQNIFGAEQAAVPPPPPSNYGGGDEQQEGEEDIGDYV